MSMAVRRKARKVKQSDLDEQGVTDAIELAQISGLFISGSMPSRESAVAVIDGTGHWIGSDHMIKMK